MKAIFFHMNFNIFNKVKKIINAALISKTLRINSNWTLKTDVKFLRKGSNFYNIYDWLKYGMPNNQNFNDSLTSKDIENIFYNFKLLKIFQNRNFLKFTRRNGQFSKLDSRKDFANKIYIIVPIFNGFDVLKHTLPTIVRQAYHESLKVLFINDSSDDLLTLRLIDDLNNQYSNIILINNEMNMGYTKSANRGLKFAGDKDTILINSDVLLPDNFLKIFLKAVAGCQNEIISPLEITRSPYNSVPFSIPLFSKNADLDIKDIIKKNDDLNKSLSRNFADTFLNVPTVHGFCMYIPRKIIKKIGYFNEIDFPRGYGEENEFCMRAIRSNFTPKIFMGISAFHFVTSSFSVFEKQELVKSGLSRLDYMFPEYKIMLKYFQTKSSISLILLNLVMNLKGFRLHQVVSSGGGSERFANHDIGNLDETNLYIQTRSECNTVRLFLNEIGIFPFVELDIYSPELDTVFKNPNLAEFISHYLAEDLGKTNFVLEALNPRARKVLRFHDYHVICPQNFLSNHNFEYCKEPEEIDCYKCISLKRPGINPSISVWRKELGNLVNRFDYFSAPSDDTINRLNKYFSSIKINKFVPKLLENNLSNSFVNLQLPTGKNIAVIGDIGYDKGLFNLFEIARNPIFRSTNLKIFFAGSLPVMQDMDITNLIFLGKYSDDNISKLIEQLYNNDVGFILFPGKIPETYSLVLSIFLNYNFGIIAFDIGAIAERLRLSRLNYLLLPLNYETNLTCEKINSFIHSSFQK
jgi:GT2 family glycosyltransferase